MKARMLNLAIQPRGVAILAAFLALVALVLAGCQSKPEPSVRDDTVIAAGRRLYVNNCTVCHGEQGDMVADAPLNLKSFLDSRGDAVLVHVVNEGKGIMPGWGQARGGPLSRDDVTAVVAYLNSAAGRTSPSLLANSGRNVFQQKCSRCHGDGGDRVPVAPLAAKPFMDSRTDDQLFQAISDGRGVMPAFRTGSASPLSEEQVRAVVSYMRYNADASVAEESRIGRELYVSNCLPCHGERGDRIPNVALGASDWLQKLGDGGVTSTIADGKGVMPAFASTKGGTFQVAQLASILAYLKSWAGLPAGSALTTTAMPSEGKELYLRNCTGCHGENGDKVSGVNLKSHAFLDTRSDDTLVREISQGNAHGMPAWGKLIGGPLKEQEVRSLIEYLRSIAKSMPLAVTAAPEAERAGFPGDVAARGKELYRQQCAACHGEGRDKVRATPLSDRLWLEQQGDELLAQAIAYGKGSMPSWGKERRGPLSQSDIEAILVYLKSSAGTATTASAGSPQPSPTVAPSNGRPAASEADLGKTIFAKNCGACHGEKGDRISAAKLADAGWLRQRGDAALSQSIASGKGAMPSLARENGGVLSKSDIAAVISYLKEAAGIRQETPAPVGTTGPTSQGVATAPATPPPAGLSVPAASTPPLPAAQPTVQPTGQPTAAVATLPPTPIPAAPAASGGDSVRGKELYTKYCTACHGERGDRLSTAKLADVAWLAQRGDAALNQAIAEGKGGMRAWGKEKGGPLSAEDVAAIVSYLKAAAETGR